MLVGGKIDTTEFNAALREFAKKSRGDMSRVVRFQGLQLFKRIVGFTPPGGDRSLRKAQAMSMGVKNITPRRQGRIRVAKDLKKAVRPLKPTGWGPSMRKRMRQVINAKDHQAITAIFKNFSHADYSNTTSVPFSYQLHESMRDRRGRVRSMKPFVTPDWSEWQEHLRIKQYNVGRAKGGWAESIVQLGGKPADWWGKKRKMGSARNSLSSPSPSFVGINTSEWSSRGDDDRIIANVLRSRTVQMRKSLRYVMGQSAKGAGFNWK